MASSNICDFNITPSRKRKRQFEKEISIKTSPKCFTNAAFNSTPKKIVAKRRIPLKKSNDNIKILPNRHLEVKPNAELAERRNPYEVLRKPPKKKKRNAEEVCFENPALNLGFPEKQFNPYEVVREITTLNRSNCFSNPALNLKVEDASILRNPFEVPRLSPKINLVKLKSEANAQPVLDNPFILSPEAKKNPRVLTPIPCQFQLGLPFVPKVGCRIDFKNVSISQLTPSKLLAEKLVFSPGKKTKLSLDSIGEESTMDIGKELDRYQLELENSINEAKQRKSCLTEEIISSLDTRVVDVELKSKFAQQLSDISEHDENSEIFEEDINQSNTQKGQNIKKLQENMADNPFRYDLKNQYQKTETAEVIEIEDLDELYGCSATELEVSFDFKTPTPFVRAYTKHEPTNSEIVVSKESLESLKNSKLSKADNDVKPMNIKNIVRKSIRKLMLKDQHDQQEREDDNSTEKLEHEKHHGFMNAIRQSFRRKVSKNFDGVSQEKENEISIIDNTERITKLKSAVLHTEYAKIEELTTERKHTLRNSLKKTSRNVRNQFLKSVFQKQHEEYEFNK